MRWRSGCKVRERGSPVWVHDWDGAGLVGVRDGAGLVGVRDGAGLVGVREGAGLVRVRDGAGLIRVRDDDQRWGLRNN